MQTVIDRSGRTSRSLSETQSPGPRVRFQPSQLPEDVREWIDPCALALIVREETEVGLWGTAAQLPGLDLSRILAYAYATGRLASDDISAACHDDPALRWLGRSQTPLAHELTSFRRRNRLQLENLLTRIFARVLDAKADASGGTRYPQLLNTAKTRLDIARHLDPCD